MGNQANTAVVPDLLAVAQAARSKGVTLPMTTKRITGTVEVQSSGGDYDDGQSTMFRPVLTQTQFLTLEERRAWWQEFKQCIRSTPYRAVAPQQRLPLWWPEQPRTLLPWVRFGHWQTDNAIVCQRRLVVYELSLRG
jgi:hypothetical protein